MKILTPTLIAFSFVFFNCSKTPEAKTTPAAQSQPGNSSVSVAMVSSVRANEGKKAAEFTWNDGNGNKVTFSDFAKDNIVLVNFWATWCGPCKAELPDLVSLHNDYKGKNVKVIGISVDRDTDVLGLVRNFAAEHKITYPIVVDDGRLEEAFGGIRGITTSFFVNKKGEVVKKLIGLQSKETFESALIAAEK